MRPAVSTRSTSTPRLMAASAASQLAEREREIKAAYERASADREATCKRREATADKRVQDVERSGAIDLKEAEDRFMALEVELRDKVARAEQAKGQAESRLRETVAESDGATTQRQEQLERLISEVKSLRSDNVRLDRLNTDKDGKISDLLQTLVDLEAGFVREHEALGKERDALALELDSQCVELEELQRVSGSYEKALTKMEKKMEKKIESSAPWSEPMPMFVASGSAKDAGWAKNFGPTKKTVVVLSQCPWAWVEKWAHLDHAAREKDETYAAFKKQTKEVTRSRAHPIRPRARPPLLACAPARKSTRYRSRETRGLSRGRVDGVTVA